MHAAPMTTFTMRLPAPQGATFADTVALIGSTVPLRTPDGEVHDLRVLATESTGDAILCTVESTDAVDTALTSRVGAWSL